PPAITQSLWSCAGNWEIEKPSGAIGESVFQFGKRRRISAGVTRVNASSPQVVDETCRFPLSIECNPLASSLAALRATTDLPVAKMQCGSLYCCANCGGRGA